jgi:hypothetical protein
MFTICESFIISREIAKLSCQRTFLQELVVGLPEAVDGRFAVLAPGLKPGHVVMPV